MSEFDDDVKSIKKFMVFAVVFQGLFYVALIAGVLFLIKWVFFGEPSC